MGAMFIQTPNGAERVGGGGSGVDVTASVGQTIVVKEVDANGKPTKWEAADYQPRTHWSETKELLPPTTPAFDEETGVFVAEVSFEFVVGNTYMVNWNGTPYTCTVVESEGVGGIGNIGAISGTGDSGEPFVMFVVPGEGILNFAALDGSTSVTLSIAEVKHTPIPVQYVTNALPYYIEITGSGTDDDPYVCNDAVANVEAIIATGCTVCTRIRLPGIEQIYYRTLSVAETEYGNSIYFVGALAGISSPFKMAYLAPQSNGLYKVTLRGIN